MRTRPAPSFTRETGGITILVALMLLVLLTIAAVGMSRNSFRETVISGTARQGSMTRNVGDSGVEWSVFWLDLNNVTSPTATAAALRTCRENLLLNSNAAGLPWDPYNPPDANPATTYTYGSYNTSSPPAPPADMTLPPQTSSGGVTTTMGYSVALTRMGKLPITGMSQTADSSGFTPARGGINKQAPDLWAVRSDARVTVGSGPLAPTFVHAKEAWISTPVQ